ncbi:MAG: hypothetical protein SWY16_09155 [Cyanobacteriota bacterium]|nr:hypothetical protein [Cyanobacteriota bacterium]
MPYKYTIGFNVDRADAETGSPRRYDPEPIEPAAMQFGGDR